MPGTSPDRFPALPAAALLLAGSLVMTLAGCAGGANDTARLSGETDVACIHRLYDYPARAVPFQVAAADCAGRRVVDLSGDRYYQVLARSLNVPFTSRDKPGTDVITLTGSRLAQPTDQPASPQLSLH